MTSVCECLGRTTKLKCWCYFIYVFGSFTLGAAFILSMFFAWTFLKERKCFLFHTYSCLEYAQTFMILASPTLQLKQWIHLIHQGAAREMGLFVMTPSSVPAPTYITDVSFPHQSLLGPSFVYLTAFQPCIAVTWNKCLQSLTVSHYITTGWLGGRQGVCRHASTRALWQWRTKKHTGPRSPQGAETKWCLLCHWQRRPVNSLWFFQFSRVKNKYQHSSRLTMYEAYTSLWGLL